MNVLPENIDERYFSIMEGKLCEQRVKDLSDSEIERAFRECIGQVKLTRHAKMLRDQGILTLEGVKAVNPSAYKP